MEIETQNDKQKYREKKSKKQKYKQKHIHIYKHKYVITTWIKTNRYGKTRSEKEAEAGNGYRNTKTCKHID